VEGFGVSGVGRLGSTVAVLVGRNRKKKAALFLVGFYNVLL
jgi:hypothetical protein